MTAALIILALIYCGPAAWFDYRSTTAASANGAHEANPVMKWVQGWAGRYWGWPKAALMWAVAGAVTALLPTQWAVAVLGVLDFVQLTVVLENYRLAREPK